MVINTKFDIGETVYYVFNKDQKRPFKVRLENAYYNSTKENPITYDSEFYLENVQLGYDTYLGMKEENLFKTEEEAWKFLKEIQKD